MSRRATHLVLSAVLVAITTAWPAFAQQPPPGYQLLTAPQTSGGLLVSQRTGIPSATRLLLQGFNEVAPFFDGRPQVVGGFRDTADQYAEVGFQVKSRQMGLMGVAFAATSGGTGTLGLAFDTPNTLPHSLPRLLALLGSTAQGATGNCPPPGVNWQAIRYPDGSGQVALPAGWMIVNANQGMLEAQGPHGGAMVAVWAPVLTRAAAAQKLAFQRQISSQVGVALPEAQVLVADPTDPGSALVAIWTQRFAMLQQTIGRGGRVLRVIGVTPVPVSGVGLRQAGLVHLEFEQSGVVQQAVAHVILGIIDVEQWLYWETVVAAPTACFAQNLPTLVKIATSAQTADHILRGRLEQAAKSLQEAQDIQWQTYQNQQRSEQRKADMYTETQRGTRVIEDMPTGIRTTVDLSHSTEIVRRLNENAGTDRYREIPLWELNR